MITDSLKKLQEQEQKLKERLKALQAQKQAKLARERAKTAKKQRDEDTRRKIILGAYLIKQMSNNDEFKKQIQAGLDRYLTNDRDRVLFGLPPSTQTKPQTPTF